MSEGDAISIGRDVSGSVVIHGQGNVVTVYYSDRPAPPEPHGATRLGPNPYRGLSAFQETDHELFFGREALTEQLWKAVARFHETEGARRFLAIVGPSGSGKSFRNTRKEAHAGPSFSRCGDPLHP
jgi:conflict system STAND superfamily ATPase